MTTNDPGREPEPTDAELLRARACNLDTCGPYSEWVRIQDAIDRRGHEYLSGARPMPDTPAPDDVAQLRARIADLERENAALGAKLGAIEKWSEVVEDHESFPEGVRAFSRGYESARRWVAMWFNPAVSAGKGSNGADDGSHLSHETIGGDA